MIKPEFFDDPDVAELSMPARLFFIGLWTQADKAGRLIDDMRRLKARIFPYDAVDCEALAVELHGRNLICRYPAEEKHGYIWIRGFTKHQRPHPKEPESLIPPCPSGAVKRNGEPGKETAKPSESGVLILDSGSLESGSQRTKRAVVPRSSNASADDFEKAWAVYPRKVGKAKALSAWKKASPPVDAVLSALSWQVTQPQWTKDRGEFVPHMATWLNQRRWEDEPFHTPAVIVSTVVDWFDECQRLHGGDCSSRYTHGLRMRQEIST